MPTSSTTSATEGQENAPNQKHVKKYTILLLLPDCLAATYGQDAFFTCVSAAGVGQAIAKAQLEAAEKNGVSDLDDFFPLCVIEGEHQNIKDEV